MVLIIEALIFWNELIQGKTSFKQLEQEQERKGSLSCSQSLADIHPTALPEPLEGPQSHPPRGEIHTHLCFQ